MAPLAPSPLVVKRLRTVIIYIPTMFKNATIKFRLLFLISLLCFATLAVGVTGLNSLRATNASLKTVYSDRLVALGQLSEVLSLIQQNQHALSQAVSGPPQQLPQVSDAVERRIARITLKWNDYMATELTAREKVLAAAFIDSRKKFVDVGLTPTLAALRAGDTPAAVVLVHGALASSFADVEANMQALVNLQLEVGKSEYDASIERYTWAQRSAIGLIVLSIACGIVIGAWLVAGIARSLAQALRIANSVAAGDLTERIDIASRDEIGQLLEALQKMNTGLVAIVTEVRSGTEVIATASSQIAAGNQDLSCRTEEQASSLEETAASMEELTSTVRQNADNARQANTLAETASTVASRGGQVIGQVVATMGEINDSSRKIVDIIGVIDAIAFQTNILALNAAVEAARAGDQGRGFAVVASEVRALAGRSAEAAREIKVLIGTSSERVESGLRMAGEAGAAMALIVTRAGQVNQLMSEMSAAAIEQSTGVSQINSAVALLDQATQQNAALVEESAAAATSLRDQALRLEQAAAVFNLVAG